jgi:hypothetical protein
MDRRKAVAKFAQVDKAVAEQVTAVKNLPAMKEASRKWKDKHDER